MRPPAFLFRIPGDTRMYDFEEIRRMHLGKNKLVTAHEVLGQNSGKDVGTMPVSAILAKFG